MHSTCDTTAYDGIAGLYELWCLGDECYKPSLNFYLSYLSAMPSPMLELGIGTGRIAVELLKNNSDLIITGIDSSTKMLSICAEKYKPFLDCKRLHLLQSDFCSEKCVFPEEFGTIYMPFRTIGHVISDENRDSLFRRVFRSLKAGGVFIFDHYVFSREWAEQHNRINRIMYRSSSLTISDFYEYDFDRRIMHCSVRVNDKDVQRFLFRWFEPEEFIVSAENAGFTVRNILGDFAGGTFSRNSEEQIWILEKPFTVERA